MRGLVLVVVLFGCAHPRPPAPPPPPPAAPTEEPVIEHDEQRIQARARELYEESERQKEREEFRAKLRAGKIVCTPTGNKIHGPSAICVEKQ